MYVIKRDGRKESVHFDKITARITKLAWGLAPSIIDPIEISKKVIAGVYAGVRTSELDELAAETCASMVTLHPDYGLLAARIEVSNLHKNTKKIFTDVMNDLYRYINPQTNEHGPLIADDVYELIMNNRELLNSSIVYNRDYSYDYFGIKTLMRSYLLKLNGEIVERPQHMLMRVAVGIHKGCENAIGNAIETYNLMSQKWFTHATPTLFNSGTRKPQMSSCFLLTMKEDSIEGIYDTLKQCAQISKNAGGIGVAIHCIRASGSYIRGTNGTSNGIVPMLRVFNNTARYVDQGGGKRKGSFAMYLEPWHADIFQFLDLRKNTGNEEERTRDLFLGLWIPDLFMKRVEKDEQWSLMCPNACKGLYELFGEEFEQLYCKYEREKRFKRQIKARELWSSILQSQIETGTPYMCYKDAVNRKSNQKNLGTIKSSNLCTEIMEYTAVDEVAVCNLASIALPMFVVDAVLDDNSGGSCTPGGSKKNIINYNTNGEFIGGKKRFDFQKLIEITTVITKNLNKIIDGNLYPVEEAKNSNMRHRPIGIGIQGLADVFLMMRIAFDSAEAKQLNSDIFECMYYAACQTSMELAKKDGPYKTFEGCPASKGLLQFDLWYHEKPVGSGSGGGRRRPNRTKCPVGNGIRNSKNSNESGSTSGTQSATNSSSFSPSSEGPSTTSMVIVENNMKNMNINTSATAAAVPAPVPVPESHATLSGKFDWQTLKANIAKYGMRNSLLLAPMPTASTSQILGNNECFEPYTSNVYIRRTLAGEFICINNHLLRDLISLGIWTPLLKDKLISARGSVQKLDEIPAELKVLYKTVWELSQKTLIDMAADRGRFVDQSQSFNIHMTGANYGKLTSMHFYGWKKGLKTGMYYLRTKAAVDAIQFTVDKAAIEQDEQLRNSNNNGNNNKDQSSSTVTVAPETATAAVEQDNNNNKVCHLRTIKTSTADGNVIEEECLMCGS